MARRPLVIIGFHGGGPYYTEPLIAQGRMPNWQRLAAEGLTAHTSTTWPVAACAWVTLLTGLDVAEHGIVDVCEFDARKFPSMSARTIDASSYRDETLLSLASAAGRSVAALSVPMTAPAWPINGVLVPGVPVLDEVRPPTWPPELRDEVAPVSLCRYDEVDVRDPDACRRYLDFDLKRMLELGKEVYQRRDWDLFILVFKVPDLANHLFCENPAVPEWRSLIDHYLVATDRALGEVLDVVDGDATLMVLSDHGSGPMPHTLFRASTWLEEEALLARKAGGVADARALARLHALYRQLVAWPPAQRAKAWLPEALVAPVRSLGHHWPFVDLSCTKVYPVDLFYPLAGFEVNLQGREEHGIVGVHELEPLCQRLAAALSDLRLPGTGRPLCRRVHRREDLFVGRHAERLPDVIAELDEDVEADMRFGDGVFASNPGRANYPHRGYHRHEGLLLMRGADVAPGRVLRGVRVHDLMPTTLRLLDVPVPPDRSGRFIPDLV